MDTLSFIILSFFTVLFICNVTHYINIDIKKLTRKYFIKMSYYYLFNCFLLLIPAILAQNEIIPDYVFSVCAMNSALMIIMSGTLAVGYLKSVSLLNKKRIW